MRFIFDEYKVKNLFRRLCYNKTGFSPSLLTLDGFDGIYKVNRYSYFSKALPSQRAFQVSNYELNNLELRTVSSIIYTGSCTDQRDKSTIHLHGAKYDIFSLFMHGPEEKESMQKIADRILNYSNEGVSYLNEVISDLFLPNVPDMPDLVVAKSNIQSFTFEQYHQSHYNKRK